ncbi:MAG: hypothetical protein AB1650_06385 [Candidatus Omnitrophota bacterium]
MGRAWRLRFKDAGAGNFAVSFYGLQNYTGECLDSQVVGLIIIRFDGPGRQAHIL